MTPIEPPAGTEPPSAADAAGAAPTAASSTPTGVPDEGVHDTAAPEIDARLEAPAEPALAGIPAAAGPIRPRRGRALARGAFVGFARTGRELLQNLGGGFALLLLRPRDAARWHAGGGALLALVVLHLAIGLAYDLYAVGWREGHFDTYALPGAGFWALALLLGAALLVALAAPRAGEAPSSPDRATPSGLALVLACAGFSLAFWQALLGVLLASAADHSAALDRIYPLLYWLPPLWVAVAFARAARLLCAAAPFAALPPDLPAASAQPRPSRTRRAAFFVLAAATVLAPQWAVDPAAGLWTGDAVEEPAAASGPDSAQSEQTLYGQFDLLNDALDAIAPGQEGVTELFTLSFAGDGSQDVFLNEAVGADSVMADVFDSGEHSLVLANSVAHPQDRPFATVSALERALTEIADRMNVDDDVLALFLTSHGSADHRLSVSLPPYQFDDLTPERLRGLLDEAGIRYRVIIVSSCYSGGFLEPLSGPDTMVITASRADRTSFGCRDGAQWTDFGRAYFAEALAQTASFEGAFRIAKGRIAEREANEGLTPSEPQIFVGPGIREQLQRLETRKGGRILFAAAGPPQHPE